MFWTDLTQLTGAVLLMIGALLPVVNPLGDAPIFLAMTPGCDEPTRADLARRIAVYSFFLLLGAMLFGSFVLLMFGLSIPVVQVGGGAVVCALGWKVLSDSPKPADAALDAIHANAIALGRVFAPLTMPLTIDAGAISVAITVGANHAHTFKTAMIQVVASGIGAGIIALTILLSYRYAQRGGRRIGRTGMTMVVRLSAFIMVCIGVGISWNGAKALLTDAGIAGHYPMTIQSGR
jgi:multiple antibiotic resistance protein